MKRKFTKYPKKIIASLNTDKTAREAVDEYLTDDNFLSMSTAERKIVAKANNSVDFQVYIVAAYETLKLAGVAVSDVFENVYDIVIQNWEFSDII